MNHFGVILALGLAGSAMAGTLLTYDIRNVAAGVLQDQAYGDRVTGPSDAVGSYGTDNGVYTPNVVATHGGAPRVWTTGYGNLTNVHYNDFDGQDITLTLTADPGFLVTLQSFDLAAFGSNHTIPNTAITVSDGGGNVLFSLAGPLVVSGSTHNSFTPSVSAQSLLLTIHVGQLSLASDNVALDNVLFSQQTADNVPEPATFGLMAGALATFVWKRRGTRTHRA